jgi:hypothetical protein
MGFLSKFPLPRRERVRVRGKLMLKKFYAKIKIPFQSFSLRRSIWYDRLWLCAAWDHAS